MLRTSDSDFYQVLFLTLFMKKRLRKKLRLREFQEMGFHVNFDLNIPFTDEAEFDFLDEIVDFIEQRRLEIGGSMSSFYVTYAGRGSATEADREALNAWLQKHPSVSNVKVWPLDDVWYGPFVWLAEVKTEADQ